MAKFEELKSALGAGAVVAGAAFASGREVSSFFACTGRASWAGIFVAASVFGLAMGMLCRFARETGADTLYGIYACRVSPQCGEAVEVVHVLLMLMMGAVALSTAGELGRLWFEGSLAPFIAAGGALITAFLLTSRGMATLSRAGIFAVPAMLVFFIALAIDPREPSTGAYIINMSHDFDGSVIAALVLALLFAFLKAAMASCTATSRAHALRPWLFGACCGGVLAALLAAANVPLQIWGAEIWSLNLPMVVLAARWGTAGYYISIFVMYIGAVCVLSCALGSIMGVFSRTVSRPVRWLITASAVMLMSATGLKPLVEVGYPMLGYMCAITLGALAFFFERRKKAGQPLSRPALKCD